ncbi:MAG: hypothetical protein A4E49_03292 [Methanosaeta sp. PtaU1.Bin112]|nr:MAG: hypothetical protein A4E49_03292 [Methanosaeta sp. PtaU1.Bin112]
MGISMNDLKSVTDGLNSEGLGISMLEDISIVPDQ